MSELKGRKILLGICGSIAAYKSALLVRLLVKEGAEVKVVMTRAATGFIAPLTLATLSKNKVLSDIIDDKEALWNNHVELGLWADVMLIAPASANTIAKCAMGLCDTLLQAVYLSARCPVCMAPAMDEDMWKHPATVANIQKLISFGNRMVAVEYGELASGLTGEGRMAEPETIVAFLKDTLKKANASSRLKGMKALVTAGPTHEPIDPVRFIGNHSSGKMGIAIADQLAHEGAEVQLVLGPSALAPLNKSISIKRVTSADEMYEATLSRFAIADITVMAAAVADFTPALPSEKKIKKGSSDTLQLTLKKTPDVLLTLGEKKRDGQLLAGFALETDDELKHAEEKLTKKNLDFIVLNSLKEAGAGFRHDTNRITIIDRNKKRFPFPLKSKQEVAKDVVDFIVDTLKKQKLHGH